MNLTFVTGNNCKPQTCRGFALVVALSLMAFMLVLVVTLLSLMEVETRSADNSLELQKAREGARMALNMAIDQLQEYAGNDRRVTARADITGATTDEATHWTGVWDAGSSSSGWPKWLVSGTTPLPTSALNESNSIELVGNNTVVGGDDSDFVRAPFIEISDVNGNVSSRIAWWISDEGIKASFGQLPLRQKLGNTGDANYPNSPPNFTPESSLHALQTMLSTSHGLEKVFNDYDPFDSASDADAKKLNRIHYLDQFLGLNDFADNWSQTNEEEFHALTPMSLGVLASTDGNGLMQDLSLFPDVVGEDDFTDIINNATDTANAKASSGTTNVSDLRLSVSLKESGALSNGSISDHVTPIITNFMLAFAIFETNEPSHDKPFLRMHFFCELWNPYTCSIPTLQNNDNLYYELQITGLPTVAIQTSDGTPPGNDIDLQDILGDPDPTKTNNPLVKPLVIELNYDPDDPVEAWLPGMTKNWTGIDATSTTISSPYTSTQTLTKNWSDPAFTLGGDSGIRLAAFVRDSDPLRVPTDQIGIISVPPTASGNSITVRLYSVNETTSPASRELLTQVNGINYDPINVNPFQLVNSTSFERNDARFGYHFLLKGPHHSNDDTEYNRGRWLFDNDPRNPYPDLSGNIPPAYVPVTDGITAQAAPIFPHNLNKDSISITDSRRLWDRSIIDSDPLNSQFSKPWQDAPLFELPRERILSLASLQHLYFHGERPFRVGNSWGQEGNFPNSINTLEWFDRYYFSGLSRSDTLNASNFEIRNGFPNPLLLPYNLGDNAAAITKINDWQGLSSNDIDDSKELAQNLLSTNRFNLNSTSVSAWMAVLGGLQVDDWPYIDEPDDRAGPTATATVLTDSREGPMFARFSHTLSETYDAPTATGAPSEFYRRGARYLRQNTAATTDQLKPLAQQIVSRIKARNTPFLTMEQFLQDPSIAAGNGLGAGSLIEQAIAAVFAPSGVQEWDQSWEIDKVGGSPPITIDHFSPGFLAQADIMTAIGPMLAPRSDTFKIRARCQTLSPFNPDEVIGDATIEAVIQRVPDPVDPNDDINDSINRKFKIMSVRWLTEDEL